MRNRKIDTIKKDINRYFGYLFNKGFKFHRVEYSPQFFGNWVVELEAPNCMMYLTDDRNWLILEFCSTNNLDVNNRVSIEKMIFILSDGKVTIEPYTGNRAWGKKKQLRRLSDLLETNIDEIMIYFNTVVEH